MSDQKSEGSFEGWAILEVMGHRKLAGYLSEQVIAGASFIRLDVMQPDGTPILTQYYNPASVYCITPTTQILASKLAVKNQPAPVTRWELSLPPPASSSTSDWVQGFEDDEDDNDE